MKITDKMVYARFGKRFEREARAAVGRMDRVLRAAIRAEKKRKEGA